jgi:4-methyl-5(b-hydroxyethyl)-thiazole monophosphate biosynthesis
MGGYRLLIVSILLVMYTRLFALRGGSISRRRGAALRMSTSDGKPTALVPVADGSEEIETVTIIDTLVRGGVEVTVASASPTLTIRASRGVKLEADCRISCDQCTSTNWDLIAVPGGMPGATNLRDSAELTALLKKQKEQKRLIAAICAAPAVVLQHHGLLNGAPATCYPADAFTDVIKDSLSQDAVVVSDNIVTSRGPGTALAFSIKLVELLVSKEVADEVAGAMLLNYK